MRSRVCNKRTRRPKAHGVLANPCNQMHSNMDADIHLLATLSTMSIFILVGVTIIWFFCQSTVPNSALSNPHYAPHCNPHQ